jgi:hypothetical protein
MVSGASCKTIGNANFTTCGESYRACWERGAAAMKTTTFLLLGPACVAVVFAVGVRGEAGRRFGGCGVDGVEGGDDCGGI